jgi:hypothetical protein
VNFFYLPPKEKLIPPEYSPLLDPDGGLDGTKYCNGESGNDARGFGRGNDVC